VPALVTVRGLALPTDDYRPSAAQQNVVADAVQLRITACMSEYGFTWIVPAGHVAEGSQVDRLYGVADLSVAQAYGYHPPPAGGQPTKGTHPRPSVPPTELLVLSGSSNGMSGAETSSPGSYNGKPIPVGGCSGRARREVTGVDEIDPDRVADAITVTMWERSKTDTRVVKVVRAWSDCMQRSGYRYASPLDAGVDHPEWLQSPSAGAAEIRTAVADVGCKRSTNLIGVWFTVESAYERLAIQPHLPELTDAKNRWKQAARKAADIMGVSTPQ
jgi:hypothetical protein